MVRIIENAYGMLRDKDTKKPVKGHLFMVEYSDYANLKAQIEKVQAVADVLSRNITENGLDTHRIKIAGGWHEGPVVNACRDILVAVKQAILVATDHVPAPLKEMSRKEKTDG